MIATFEFHEATMPLPSQDSLHRMKRIDFGLKKNQEYWEDMNSDISSSRQNDFPWRRSYQDYPPQRLGKQAQLHDLACSSCGMAPLRSALLISSVSLNEAGESTRMHSTMMLSSSSSSSSKLPSSSSYHSTILAASTHPASASIRLQQLLGTKDDLNTITLELPYVFPFDDDRVLRGSFERKRLWSNRSLFPKQSRNHRKRRHSLPQDTVLVRSHSRRHNRSQRHSISTLPITAKTLKRSMSFDSELSLLIVPHRAAYPGMVCGRILF